tara:strand:- start:158 stop:514 length:357 start_codon:yes stop_codon:yes gene_type:complete
MKNIKFFFLSLLLISTLTSCESSDDIVNIYGASEYNCTTQEYRILKPNLMIPFLKSKKWYTREEFHESYYEYTLEPYKDLAISDSTLAEIAPSVELSSKLLDELIIAVDCENPKDVKF